MLKITAAALLALVSAPALAADGALQQPEVTVAGYDCCEPACDAPCQGCCDAAGDCGSCCDSGCCDDACCGRDCCVATVEKVKVEKHCWCTETKKVCVPKVVCPWGEGGSGLTIFNFLRKSKNCGDACCGDACCGDACCDSGCCDGGCCGAGCGCLKPRCGKVICVKDLVKKKYECEECVCKWEVRRLPPCVDCCDSCCEGSPSDACCGCVE